MVFARDIHKTHCLRKMHVKTASEIYVYGTAQFVEFDFLVKLRIFNDNTCKRFDEFTEFCT
jgi:hypothetical protein